MNALDAASTAPFGPSKQRRLLPPRTFFLAAGLLAPCFAAVPPLRAGNPIPERERRRTRVAESRRPTR